MYELFLVIVAFILGCFTMFMVTIYDEIHRPVVASTSSEDDEDDTTKPKSG